MINENIIESTRLFNFEIAQHIIFPIENIKNV